MRSLFVILIIPILLFIACSNENKTAVNEVLDNREKAFETKDQELYSGLISESYNNTVQGKLIDKNEIVKKFKINTTPFDVIEIVHSDRVIEIENDSATAVQRTKAKLEIEDESSVYEIREIIRLTRENNIWKISGESKIDLFRGFVFGAN